MQATMSCAQESRAAEEPLAGTVKPADTFFLIESGLPAYGGWGASAVKKAAAAGEFSPILARLQALPRAKILFIRRPQSNEKNFYIALTNQAVPRIYHAHLDDYAELLTLDSNSLQPGASPRLGGRAMTEIEELYLVCTNGRHDPCCAMYGTPVYQKLAALAPAGSVWQTTHIGGHRFAATMIAFPHGIVYGQLDPADAEQVLVNQRAGCLLTHKYRGRGAYPGRSLDADAHYAATAAEALIRELTRNYGIDDLRLSEVMELGAQERRIRFVDAAGASISADVKTSLSPPRRTSCGDPPKPMPQHEVALHSRI